ncbi:MAG: hypothetical protein ABIH03_03020 [Pseudomonadota bacterium]
MIASLVIVWGLVLLLGVIALRRSTDTVGRALRVSVNQGKILALRMPLAILIGEFTVDLIPQQTLQSMIGGESGVTGILIASLAGSLMPGGPAISFPIAVAFYKAGVGAPQLIALLTAWSVYAFHRALIFELPMMGGRFVALRLASSAMFPLLAGIVSALALRFISIS